MKSYEKCSLEDAFFGSVTVGERGQVVIPAEARKRLKINPGEKLLVMSHPLGAGLALMKIDTVQEFLSSFMNGLSGALVDETEKKDAE